MDLKVWCQIREEGFGTKKEVKTRDVTRLWSRRHQIARGVELLELGRAGGVFKGLQEEFRSHEAGMSWRWPAGYAGGDQSSRGR